MSPNDIILYAVFTIVAMEAEHLATSTILQIYPS